MALAKFSSVVVVVRDVMGGLVGGLVVNIEAGLISNKKIPGPPKHAPLKEPTLSKLINVYRQIDKYGNKASIYPFICSFIVVLINGFYLNNFYSPLLPDPLVKLRNYRKISSQLQFIILDYNS